jgi:lipase
MLDVRDTPVFVRRWGPEDGRPLLFFHSLGPAASGALIDVATAPLVAAGYTIAAPDAPGFGRSPTLRAAEYEVGGLAERGVALADRLGWDHFVLGGHSWGGSIAVHIAAAQPRRVRALVLADSGHLDYRDDPSADLTSSLEELTAQQAARSHRAADRAGVARDLELPVDDPVVDSFLEGTMDDGEGGLITRTSPSTRAAALYHLARARQSAQWPTLAAANIPVLLLLATVPEEVRTRNEAGAERFRAAVPQADVRFVEGATHSLITDIRERFGATVAEWLASLE